MLSSAPRSASRASLARRDELRDEDRDDPRDEPRGARALLGLFSDGFSGVESSFIGSRMGSCIGSCNCCARSSAVVDSEGWCLCSIHDAYMRVNHHETLVWHPTSTCLCMFLHTRVVRARCPTRACECAIFRAISQARTHHLCVLLTSQPCVAPHVRFLLLRTACAIRTSSHRMCDSYCFALHVRFRLFAANRRGAFARDHRRKICAQVDQPESVSSWLSAARSRPLQTNTQVPTSCDFHARDEPRMKWRILPSSKQKTRTNYELR